MNEVEIITDEIRAAAIRHGIRPSEVHRSRIKGSKARHDAMIRLRKRGMSVEMIARGFGLDATTVYSITRNATN